MAQKSQIAGHSHGKGHARSKAHAKLKIQKEFDSLETADCEPIHSGDGDTLPLEDPDDFQEYEQRDLECSDPDADEIPASGGRRFSLEDFLRSRRSQLHVLLEAPSASGGMKAIPAFKSPGKQATAGMSMLIGFLEFFFSERTRKIWGELVCHDRRNKPDMELVEKTARVLMDCMIELKKGAPGENFNKIKIHYKANSNSDSMGNFFTPEEVTAARFGGKFAMLPWAVPFCTGMLLADGRGLRKNTKPIFKFPEWMVFLAFNQIIREEEMSGIANNDDEFCHALYERLQLNDCPSEKKVIANLREKWKEKAPADKQPLHTLPCRERQKEYNRRRGAKV